MCTALSLRTKHGCFFGRNMDLPRGFGQSPLYIPRRALWGQPAAVSGREEGFALLGMGVRLGGYPAMADAVNEKGLACAALNFPDSVSYAPAAPVYKTAVPPWDFILWALRRHDSVETVRRSLREIELVDLPINGETPLPTLHWMLADRSGDALVVERTRAGLAVCANPVGVMANDPPFDWQLTNLRNYMGIAPRHPAPVRWSDAALTALGMGAGTYGLPGGFSSVDRFVRAAFLRAHMPEAADAEGTVSAFFRVLDNVAMAPGAAETADGAPEQTLYSACMDLERGRYIFKTGACSRLWALSLGEPEQMGETIRVYPYPEKQDFLIPDEVREA